MTLALITFPLYEIIAALLSMAFLTILLWMTALGFQEVMRDYREVRARGEWNPWR